MTKDTIQEQPDVTFANEEMLKTNEKAQIESYCTDNVGYNGNKDTKVKTDIIQEQPDVTFADEELFKSNEKHK